MQIITTLLIWCTSRLLIGFVAGDSLVANNAHDIFKTSKSKNLDELIETRLNFIRQDEAIKIQQLETSLLDIIEKLQASETQMKVVIKHLLDTKEQLQEAVNKISSTEHELAVVKTDLKDTKKQLKDAHNNFNAQLKEVKDNLAQHQQQKPLQYENLEQHRTLNVSGSSRKRLLEGPSSSTGSSTVAFSSYFQSTVKELGFHHTIPFDTVIANEGSGFDPLLHVFTCPSDGTYVFMTALLADFQQNTVTEIVINGSPLVLAYSAGGNGSHGYDQGFNSVITHCNAGDRVWVQIHNHQGETVFGGRFSTFSGYKLS